MELLIGMDEAGYGPNLGPLVVAATAWGVEEQGTGDGGQGAEELRYSDCPPRQVNSLRIEQSQSQSAIRNPKSAARLSSPKSIDDPPDLYHALGAVVARGRHAKRIGIADSKTLYKPGQGLRQLERGVHATQFCLRQTSNCWSDLVSHCVADPDGHVQNVPWHEDFNCSLPADADAKELLGLGEQLAEACAANGVWPIAVRARLVFPAEFNDLTERFGSKGAALSHVTVGLLREAIDSLNWAPNALRCASRLSGLISVICDKHGGRNFYGAILQHHFPEHWIEPICEGARESRYEWGTAESRTRVSFRVGGEAFLPTALASMTAKYLRELAMRAFNEFWCARVPGLKPTAGYPLDARRFRQEIATTQRELGIEGHVLWRNR